MNDRDAVLRGFEDYVVRLVAKQTMKHAGLTDANYKRDDIPEIVFRLDDYPEAIKITVKAEWVALEMDNTS